MIIYFVEAGHKYEGMHSVWACGALEEAKEKYAEIVADESRGGFEYVMIRGPVEFGYASVVSVDDAEIIEHSPGTRS